MEGQADVGEEHAEHADEAQYSQQEEGCAGKAARGRDVTKEPHRRGKRAGKRGRN